MTDEEIIQRFYDYFEIDHKFSFTSSLTVTNGLVSCDKTVRLRSWRKRRYLPIKFDEIGKHFICAKNELESLVGSPKIVTEDFACSDNKLQSLEGAPRYVGGDFACSENPLKSLKGLPQYVGGSFFLTYDKNLPLLRLLMVYGCKNIIFVSGDRDISHLYGELVTILSKYLGKGHSGMLACAEEMHNAGYGSNAYYD